MSEYVDFHYMPLEGKITGKQVLQQTEDVINDLGNKVHNLDVDESRIDEAIENSEQAINTANSALAAVTTDRAVWENTVAEMKATDIDLGVTAATRGKMVFNDGNGAFYGVRSEKSGDVDSDDTVFLNNGNVAERIQSMNIIAKGNNIIFVASVAELIDSDALIGNVYGTAGYYSANDGGAGLYSIRNKTQSDVEDGGSIIFLNNGNVAECIDLNIPRTFDTVADLKNASLFVGLKVSTKGYYSVNDGGSALYTIRAKDVADVEDGGSIIYLDNGNVAELITDGTVNIKQFGAYGDGVHDDTTAIQNAVAMQGTVLFGVSESYIVATDSIYIKRNTTIDLNGSTVLLNNHYFMNCKRGEDSLVYNGHGNITITNGTLVNGEILLAHGKDIKVTFVNMKNSPGHFMQIMSCSDLLIKYCYFSGMADSASHNDAINLDPCVYSAFHVYGEGSPSYDGTNNQNITIENCTSIQGTDTGYTKSQALGVSHYYVNDDLYHDNVVVRNNYIETDAGTNGLILVALHNSYVENNVINSTTTPITLGNCEDIVIKGNIANNTDGYFVSMKWSELNHNLSIYDNRFSGNMINATGTIIPGNITFKKIDPFIIETGQVTTGNDITLRFPYDCFNFMRVATGSLASGTYSEDISVTKYNHVNFAATDVLYSMAGNCTVTCSDVPDKNIITCSHANNARRVWGWRD